MKTYLILGLLQFIFSANAFAYSGSAPQEQKYIPRIKATKPDSSRPSSNITLSADKITEVKFDYDEVTDQYYEDGYDVRRERPLNFSFKIKLGNKKIVLDDDGESYKESYVKKVAFAAATGRALGRNITLFTDKEDIKIDGLKDDEFYFNRKQITKITDKGFELWLGKEKVFITIGEAPMLLKLQNALEIVNHTNSQGKKLIKFDWNKSDITVVDKDEPFKVPKVEGPKVEKDKNSEVNDGSRSNKVIQKEGTSVVPEAVKTDAK